MKVKEGREENTFDVLLQERCVRVCEVRWVGENQSRA